MKKHSSGFHDGDSNGLTMNGESSSASEEYQPYSSRQTQYLKSHSFPPPIVTIAIDDSDDELDNNNEESSPDRHHQVNLGSDDEHRDSNGSAKGEDTDESDSEVILVSDEIERVSKIVSTGKNLISL